MNQKLLLVKYAEIHLKGQNRPFFQRLLLRRVQEAVSSFGAKAVLHDSRILVRDYSYEEGCALAVSRVFGVHAVSFALEMPKEDFEALKAQAAQMARGLTGTFKVVSSRSDKTYFLQSPEISAEVGHAVLMSNPALAADMHKPQHVLRVEIRDTALLYTRELPGVGGLPTGSSGKACLLLSGGIDSPVAGYRVARRGVELAAVYFHAFPFTGGAVKEKVVALARILAGYCGAVRLHVVNFTNIQTTIRDRCPDEYTTLVMRRCMMRIAARIAGREGALALVTGESLGQVASQTLEAIACTDRVAGMPVFRPLIGDDKLDIIREAERIGTFITSSLPYEDCCTVFTPRHPVTRPTLEKAEVAEKSLLADGWLETEIEKAAKEAEIVKVTPDGNQDNLSSENA